MGPMHTCSSANSYCICYGVSSGITHPRKPMSKDVPKFDRNTLPKKSGNKRNVKAKDGVIERIKREKW